jgi:hypothetical protein
MHAIISVIARIMVNSGFTFMPLVSSSKNLSSPALWAGIGAFLSSFFLLLLLIVAVSLCWFYYIIKYSVN